ncbi:TIGR02301 family protein [Caulobacter sp. S45]|uniref:TIGR02301 family protein n=1 Tax=Caulobacter sp. S45 TaxID=1641861 RepID=UPI00131B1D74|nr:TIGR02301 family protein [Caulobacter sp. S45]
MMRVVAPLASACLLALTLATAASAQAPARRTGADRQSVVHLAYVLGEAHALRRLCAGPTDATWYGHMQRLLAEEATDEVSRRQLVESFNAGFAFSQAEFATCGPRSQAAEHAVAEQGRVLAQQLASGGDE